MPKIHPQLFILEHGSLAIDRRKRKERNISIFFLRREQEGNRRLKKKGVNQSAPYSSLCPLRCSTLSHAST